MTKLVSILSILGAMSLVVACGDDDSDDGGGKAGTTSTGGKSGGGGTSSGSSGSGGTTSGSSGSGGTTQGGGGSGGAPAGDWIEGSVLEFPFVGGAYSYKDKGGSTVTLDGESGKICVSGNAVGHQESNALYGTNWGAGVGLKVATGTEAAPVAWNATTAGVTQVKFTLQVTSGTIRAGVKAVGDGDTYFVLDGEVPQQFTSTNTGATTATLAELAKPKWDEDDPGATLDATKLEALQFQSESAAADAPYEFCVSDIQWLDASGNPVEPDGGEGGAPGN